MQENDGQRAIQPHIFDTAEDQLVALAYLSSAFLQRSILRATTSSSRLSEKRSFPSKMQIGNFVIGGSFTGGSANP